MANVENIIQEADNYIYDQEHLDKAIDMLQEVSLDLKTNFSVDSFYLSTLCRLLGDAYSLAGNARKARASYQFAYATAKERLYKVDIGFCLASLCSYEVEQGNLKEASAYFKKAYPTLLFGGKKFRHMKANVLIALSKYSLVRKNEESFKSFHGRALKYTSIVKEKRTVQDLIRSVSDIYPKYLEKPDIEYFNLSLFTKFEERNLKSFLPQAYLGYAKYLMSIKENEESNIYVQKALTLSEKGSLMKEIGESYEILGDLHSENSNSTVSDFYEKALDIYKACDYPNRMDRVKKNLNNLI